MQNLKASVLSIVLCVESNILINKHEVLGDNKGEDRKDTKKKKKKKKYGFTTELGSKLQILFVHCCNGISLHYRPIAPRTPRRGSYFKL